MAGESGRPAAIGRAHLATAGAGVKDCLVCGREIHHPAKGFCAACWRPLYRQLAARMHRPVSAAEAAAMLLRDYWPIWEHSRGRAA